jgi:hypothetical protein
MAGQLRTGRGIDALLGASVDPKVATAQAVMERAMRWINEIALDTYKGYWPDRKYEVFSGWPTDYGMVKFTPTTHIETTANVVKYAIPGTDTSNLTVALGGMIGTGLVSRDTGRELHPWVSNPDGEERKIVLEALDQYMLDQVAAQSQLPEGGYKAIDIAAMRRAYAEDGDLASAVEKADRAARERQASMAPPPGEGQIAAPEAMPGLAMPGTGAESAPFEAPPAVGPVAPSLDNVRRLNSALMGANTQRG